MSVRVLSLALVLGGMASRGDLCRRTPPPVNFSSDAGARFVPDVQTTDAATDVVDAGTTAPTRTDGQAVPGDGHSLVFEGATVNAERGERFLSYLSIDPDGDNDHDLLVTVRRGSTPAAPELLYLRKDEAYVRVPVPREVLGNIAPECTEAMLSTHTGRTAVVRFRCAAAGADAGVVDAGAVANGTSQEVVSLGFTPAPVLRSRVSLLPAIGRTVLDVSLDAWDRDGDGRDDATITVSARAAGEREDSAAKAQVIYLDRGTGLARDTTEPDASWSHLSSAIRGMNSRRARAGDGVLLAERALRLRRALCAESGSVRVRINGQLGISCANSSALRSVAEAQARSHFAAGDVPAGLLLTRPESASELGVIELVRVESEFRRAAPSMESVARSGPFLGASLDGLAFARAGALVLDPPTVPAAVLLRGPMTARVELASMTLTPGLPGAIEDVLARSPDLSRVLSAFYETCEGPVAVLCAASDAECTGFSRADALPPTGVLVRVPTLVSAQLEARCMNDATLVQRLGPGSDAKAVGFGTNGVLFLLRGVLWRGPATGGEATAIRGTTPLGGGFTGIGAVSASGNYLVVGASEAVLVRGLQGRWNAWRPPELNGRYRQLSDLVISEDGRTAAGLTSGQLWLLQATGTTTTTRH